MKNKILLAVFIVFCLAQLSVISYLVYKGVKPGRTVRLKCRLYDPYDPLKGRFVQLSFDIETLEIKNIPFLREHKEIKSLDGKELYCILDEKDYIVIDLAEIKPLKQKLFIKCRLKKTENEKAYLGFDFDRYYMQEDMALTAESVLRSLTADKDDLIIVLSVDDNGGSKITGLLVNDISVEDAIK